MRFYLGLALVAGIVCAALQAHAATQNQKMKLGDTPVTIKVYKNGSGPTYFAPHHNEQTAVSAAKRVIIQKGGKLVELVHSGRRYITFTLKGVQYMFDPNRMFSHRGLEASLRDKKLKPIGNYSEEAEEEVNKFTLAVLILIDIQRVDGSLVAVHNNTEGKYSIASYNDKKSGEFGNASKIATPGSDLDDFFFVTSSSLFNALEQKGYNVGLQAGGAHDDGSLSVYCAKFGIPYVNVEAQNGHGKKQQEMLLALRGL